MEKQSNGLGIASMVVGIIALLLSCCYGGFLGIIGLILGIIVVTKSDSKKGIAITGIITSGIALLISFILLIAGAGSLMDYMGQSSEAPQIEVSTNTSSEDTEIQTESPASSSPALEYTITSQSDYIREGTLCQGFRIVTNGSVLTDNEMIAIYDEVKKNNDNYLYITLWFYEISEEDLCYAIIDEENMDGETPIIERQDSNL